MNRFSFSSLTIALALGACTGSGPVVDGGVCTPEQITAECTYRGYGTTCDVPCDLPSNCSFSVGVDWVGGGYCCAPAESLYTNCVCDHGMALCTSRIRVDGVREAPISACEFCNRDSGLIPPPDAGPRDGGRCTDEALEASCEYRGYGTTCAVPCDFSSDCTFEASVTWTGGYCCGPGNSDYFVDCVCEGGIARCRAAFTPSSLPREIPTTFCEFCEGEPDAAVEDAGVDAAGVDG